MAQSKKYLSQSKLLYSLPDEKFWGTHIHISLVTFCDPKKFAGPETCDWITWKFKRLCFILTLSSIIDLGQYTRTYTINFTSLLHLSSSFTNLRDIEQIRINISFQVVGFSAFYFSFSTFFWGTLMCNSVLTPKKHQLQPFDEGLLLKFNLVLLSYWEEPPLTHCLVFCIANTIMLPFVYWEPGRDKQKGFALSTFHWLNWMGIKYLLLKLIVQVSQLILKCVL